MKISELTIENGIFKNLENYDDELKDEDIKNLKEVIQVHKIKNATEDIINAIILVLCFAFPPLFLYWILYFYNLYRGRNKDTLILMFKPDSGAQEEGVYVFDVANKKVVSQKYNELKTLVNEQGLTTSFKKEDVIKV